MPDPEATKRRIFEAAVQEFAEHGPAGARVDRIAARARANKESIYRHFGTKAELLRRVTDQYLDQRGEQMLPRQRDLPDYGSGLVRFHAEHPEFLRMSLWEALRSGEGADQDPRRRAHYRDKLASVAELQRAGTVDPGLDPRHLLAVILGMAGYWQTLPQLIRTLFDGEVTDADLARHQDFVAECIRRIVAPRPGGGDG